MGNKNNDSNKENISKSVDELFNSVRDIANKHYRTGTSREALDKMINSAFDAIMQKIERGEEAELPDLEGLLADFEKAE